MCCRREEGGAETSFPFLAPPSLPSSPKGRSVIQIRISLPRPLFFSPATHALTLTLTLIRAQLHSFVLRTPKRPKPWWRKRGVIKRGRSRRKPLEEDGEENESASRSWLWEEESLCTVYLLPPKKGESQTRARSAAKNFSPQPAETAAPLQG